MIPGSQVIRPQSSVVRVCPDALEVIHAFPGSPASRERIACGGEISPGSSTQDPDAIQNQGFVLQHVDMAGRGVLHFSQRAINVAIVVLVVPSDVRDLAVKGFARPMDASGLFVDVAGEDYQVNPSIEGRRVETAELRVEV